MPREAVSRTEFVRRVRTCRTKAVAAAGEPDAMRPSPDGPRRLDFFFEKNPLEPTEERRRIGGPSESPAVGRSNEKGSGYLGRDGVTRTARVVAAAGARRVLRGLPEAARKGSYNEKISPAHRPTRDERPGAPDERGPTCASRETSASDFVGAASPVRRTKRYSAHLPPPKVGSESSGTRTETKRLP